ncbi:MAG: Ig domain-containing protein [Paludibacteraceae bacterium]|nr:Ig domain-containing protein [Paludibacteraceae bacterium]
MKKIFLILLLGLGAMGMQAETFNKVTDAGALKDGDKVVMAYPGASKVSGNFSDTKKFLTAVDATFADGKATLDEPTVLTLKKHGSYWNLYIGSHAVGHNTGSNDLDTKYRYTTDYAISIESNGIAKIVSQTPGKNNNQVYFRYNAASPRFNVYAANSTAVDIELYILDEGSVPDVEVKSVELNKQALELRVGDNETLTATVKPDDAVDKTLAWGSTNASIASVQNGKVTAVAEGTAKIWVKATAVEGVSDTCVVTVLPKAAEGDATYNAVQKAEYLPAGAKVFIGTIKEGENYVMGQYVSGNNIKGVAATYGEGRHSVTAPLQVAYTVEREGDYYLFVDHDGNYLRTMSSSKLGSGDNDQYAKWTLGTFDEDDATVVLKASSGKGIYNNYQGTNDLFNIYDGVGDGSNLAMTVLYSDKAPEWEAREKDPWIKVASTYIDWGKQEPDEYTKDWGDTRYVEMTMNDLPADIEVELTEDGNGTFSCYSGTISSKKTSEKFLVYWETDTKGVYDGEITLTCPGLETIKIKLHAEAVEKGSGEGEQPTLTVSHDHIYLNPTTDYGTEDYMAAEFSFTFSATNLAKNLYVKWEWDTQTQPWFPWSSEEMHMYLASEQMGLIYEEMAVNDNVNLGKEDIDECEIYIALTGIQNAGTYKSQLHFTSYKADSKTELAIDEVIPVTVIVSAQPTPDPGTDPVDPHEGIEGTRDEVQSTKVLRDGQLLIIRNGETYSATGARL